MIVYSSFAHDVKVAILEEFDKRFSNEFFCYTFQHSGHGFCCFTPLGMIAKQELQP